MTGVADVSPAVNPPQSARGAGPSALDGSSTARSCLSSSFNHPKEGVVSSLLLSSDLSPAEFEAPIFGERVYAVGFQGRVIQFLGYSDDPSTTEKVLALGDHWMVRREAEVQDSISDEWFGRAPLPPSAPERVAEEREAWEDYEFAKTHREQVAEDRFEYRGRDSRGGFSDADSKSRRQRADQQLQMELERGAEVLGDERHRQALTERKRFRVWVEAFGQDPDSAEIVAWRESKTYAACNAQLRAKALNDGVLLPSVS